MGAWPSSDTHLINPPSGPLSPALLFYYFVFKKIFLTEEETKTQQLSNFVQGGFKLTSV